jgi:hypothetical protein
MFYYRYSMIGVLALISVILATCATMPETTQTTPTIQIIPSNTPTLFPTSTLLPTITPTSTPILPTKTFTPKPTPPISPLSDFPLNLGNTWVYSYTDYSTNDSQKDKDVRNDQIITATSLITETVVNTQLHGGYFVAEIVKNKVLVTLSVDLNELDDWHTTNWDGVKSGAETYWYVITGTHVYRQEKELDLTDVESSWLEYMFPLENNRWYPDGSQREEFPDFDTGPNSGSRLAGGPIEKQLPVGKLKNCFEILTIYPNGGTTGWFCSGVGYVGSESDHMGTPSGYRMVLIDYIIKSP